MSTSYTVYGCPLCANTHPLGRVCPEFDGEVKRLAAEVFASAQAASVKRLMTEKEAIDAARDSALEEAAAMLEERDTILKTTSASRMVRELKTAPQGEREAVRDMDPPSATKCTHCLYDYGHALWCKNYKSDGFAEKQLDVVRESEIEHMRAEIATLTRERDELRASYDHLCGQHGIVGKQLADTIMERATLRTRLEAQDRALRDLLAHVDSETCFHEERHRGGAIWTICDACGQMWADDKGGFVPHTDSLAVANARRLTGGKEAGA